MRAHARICAILSGGTALTLAKYKGNTECIRLIEKHEAAAAKRASIGSASAGKRSTLSENQTLMLQDAVVGGDVEAVCGWLDHGGDIDMTMTTRLSDGNYTVEVHGMTILMAAVIHDHEKLVKELVRRKASLDLQDSFGITALLMPP